MEKNNLGLWRWTRWRDLGWEVHGKELIISVVRDLTDSLLCVFSCSNNSCLCLSVDQWQVMMVFSCLFLIVYFFLILLFVELTFPCCFSRSKSAKGWSTGSKILRLFFFLWFWYCVSFPWVSEVEIEIAVTKTNCMYTASSKVLQETSSSWLAIISF